jgi:hypothetical protein
MVVERLRLARTLHYDERSLASELTGDTDVFDLTVGGDVRECPERC